MSERNPLIGRTLRGLAAPIVAGVLAAALPASALAGATPPAPADPSAPALGACQQQTVKAGIVTATGCFTADTAKQTFTSTGKVDLNGYTVDPGGKGADAGAALTINTTTRDVRTGGKKVALGAGEIGFAQAVALGFTAPTSGNLQIGNFAYAPSPTAGEVIVELLEQISGANVSVPVWLTPEGGRIDFTASLQSFFVLVDKEKSVQFSVTVEPGKGADFESIALKADSVKLGALELDTLELDWSPSGTWSGTVEVTIPRGKDHIQVGGTLGFVNGKFNSVAINADGIHAPIGDGLFLQKLGGSFQLNPVQLGANAGIVWGDTVRIGGRDVALFELDGGVSLGATGQQFYVKVVATMYLIGIQLANGTAELWTGVASSGAALSVSVGIGIPSFRNDSSQPTYLGLSLGGWIATAQGRAEYEVDGSAQIKVLGIQLVQADAVVSNLGVSACWTIVLRG
jgi:hypothetical protein